MVYDQGGGLRPHNTQKKSNIRKISNLLENFEIPANFMNKFKEFTLTAGPCEGINYLFKFT